MREGNENVVATLLLLAVATAGVVAEGAVVRSHGGWAIAAAGVAGAAWCLRTGVEAPARPVAAAGVALLVTIAWHLLPVPTALRRLVAPGQAAWLDRAGDGGGDLDAWLAALSAYDVDAALGLAGPWTHDVLAGARAAAWHAGAIAPADARWTLALALGCAALYAAGRAAGRSERAVFAFAVAMALFGVGEALFGIANRDGPTTGLNPKLAYLGSATGTLVNRGHFAAVLCLALGGVWGVAASLFPLLPEEVRKHAARKRRSSQPPGVLEASGSKVPRLVLLAFAAAVVSVALVAAQSRGPLAAFALAAAGVGAWMAWRREERWHLGLGLGLPVAGLALASLAFGLRGAVGRFAGLLHGGDVSVTSRAQVWRESFDAFLDAPIFGHGLGSFRLVWAVHERGSHLYDFDHAHSEPVEILVELGAVGALAVAVALAAWLRGLALDADVAPQGARTAIGAGLAVGVLAVALQSLGDFPLRIPGVALLFALTAGVARGALRPPEDVKASRVAAAPVAIAGAGALLLGALAALADAPFDGTRKERIGEVHRVWFAGESVRTLSRARAWRVQAEAAAAESPLDPWAHAAVARASALVAAGEWKLDGGTPEEDAWRADRAAARALALRPRSPRLEIALAGAFTALARTSPTPDAWRERAVRLLSDAVARDAWRAQDALAVAGGLAEADLARIAGASTAEGRPRARVRYEYGQVLAKRGRKAEALAAHREAAAADPTFGPPAFQAGVLLRGVDDEEAARMLRHFLQTRDRPLAMEGWALLMLDEVDNAEARFRRAVQEAPANRWAWEGVAEVARRRGDARREMEAWQRILAIAPDDAQVRARIASIQARAD